MRTLCTAFALLSVGLLAGCTEAPASKSVETASLRPQHNFRLYGSPEKGEFMIDADTGDVWQYQQKGDHMEFVAVPKQEVSSESSSTEPIEEWKRDASGKLYRVK